MRLRETRVDSSLVASLATKLSPRTPQRPDGCRLPYLVRAAACGAAIAARAARLWQGPNFAATCLRDMECRTEPSTVVPTPALPQWARLCLCVLSALLLVLSISVPGPDRAGSGHFLTARQSGVHALQPTLSALRTKRPQSLDSAPPALLPAGAGPVPDPAVSPIAFWPACATCGAQPVFDGWDARAPPRVLIARMT